MKSAWRLLFTAGALLLAGCGGQTAGPSSLDAAAFQPAQPGMLFTAPPGGTQTRWARPENPNGDPGEGGKTNHGAKGNAFYTIAPGARQVLLDYQGAGVINRIWMSGTIARNPEQRRMVRIDMYGDDASKPAVSAPIGDFFGAGLGVLTPSYQFLYTRI